MGRWRRSIKAGDRVRDATPLGRLNDPAGNAVEDRGDTVGDAFRAGDRRKCDQAEEKSVLDQVLTFVTGDKPLDDEHECLHLSFLL